VATICQELIAPYAREGSNELDYKLIGITPKQCNDDDDQAQNEHGDDDR
jgi:hypothetical protein